MRQRFVKAFVRGNGADERTVYQAVELRNGNLYVLKVPDPFGGLPVEEFNDVGKALNVIRAIEARERTALCR